MSTIKMISTMFFSSLLFFPYLSYAEMYYQDESTDAYYSESEYQEDPTYDADFASDAAGYRLNHEAEDDTDVSAYGTRNAPLPRYLNTQGEKVIFIDPRRHAYGAYNAKGKLVRWGLATAGASWCSDIGRPCRTKTGVFRMYSLGDEGCYSRRFPVPDGGAPMPYCMYFNGGQAIHGSDQVVYGNVSHGCVRVHVDDAEWLRYQFVEGPNASNHYRGTKVIISSY